ncbi:SRPBCC family protein [Williamsia sp. D3]|uniref:SRPBCC family protein n=1 Tax=Williamsia sp. D3 TaxID=1313067 RepID=UPI0003D36B65|nr:SRPBCC family protein [Williamsia sp. D3]ETD30279.1 activator of HSP90 ATPase [Williamsia sp. D3]
MSTTTEAKIEADPNVPIIRITREFAGTPEQLLRAHTDPELFAQWIGPSTLDTRIDEWDARSGGSWRFVSTRDGEEYAFRGCFHDIRPDRIVQTFTYEGDPDGVALETLWFDDLGDGRTRLRTQSLVDSFEGRDAWLRSGMEVGVNEGYAKLEEMLTSDAV